MNGAANGVTPAATVTLGRGADPLGIAGGSAPAVRRDRTIDEPIRETPSERWEQAGPGAGRHASPEPGVSEVREETGGLAGLPGPFGRDGSVAFGGAASSPPPVMPPPDTSHTPGGLPRRVPQTHLAAPLQDNEPEPRPRPMTTPTNARRR
ncbi:hypothetical protein ACFQX6_01050 [Streptosporangium lutulentum]